MVVLGVADGVANGRCHDFDAVDLFGFLGQEQGDGPGAAVDVGHGFPAFEVGEIEGRFIEALGLFAVDLEEGLGGNVEGQGADGVVDGPFAVDGLGLGSQDDVGMALVDVLDDAGQAGDVAAQALDQVFHVRNHVAGRDQADHDFAGMDADTAHDVADDARPGVFVIGGNLEVLHPLADDGDDGVVAFFLDGAVRHVDDFVRSRSETADGDFSPAGSGDGELHLIAVMPGRMSPQGRQNVDVLQVANAFQGIPDLLALFLQFPFIAKVLELTAATAVVDGALGLDPLRRGLQDFDQGRRGVGLLDQGNADPHVFTGQGEGHEDRKAFIAADAFATRTQAGNGYIIGIPLLDGDCVFLFHRFPF